VGVVRTNFGDHPNARTGASHLDVLEQLATEAGAERIAADASALAARIRDGLYYVACVGQFKRGKSTLLNALIGEAVLPTGVVPVTSVVTVLRYGQERSARVRITDGTWVQIDPDALAEWVTEEKNPENTKCVAAIEVLCPSPLLASGMCLVDTPGIGSVFASNTETTRAFVPHIDTALVVLGADPPISADELALVEEIGKHCQHLFFVLNKADKLSALELQEASDFTRRVLTNRLGRAVTTLFEVSATERLAGVAAARVWPELVAALTTLAQQSGSELVRTAEDRGLGILVTRLHRHLDEARSALARPIDESERRVEMLRTCVAEAERSLNDLDHLFTSVQERLARVFDDHKEEFLKHAKPGARREFAEAIRATDIRRGPALRSDAIRLAGEISRRWLDRWLAGAQPAVEALYVEATQRFVDLANGFLVELASSGDPALSGLPRTVTPETGFRVRSGLYYTSLVTETSQTPVGWFFDLVRSRDQQLRALERQVGDYLETLIFTNANRIANDFIERVLESRRRLQSEIRSALHEVVASAESALARTKQLQAQGRQAVQVELARINSLGDRLATLSLNRRSSSS